MKSKKIPARLQPILWSSDVKNLDLDKHKGYIVNQILRFGNLDDIKWLLRIYGENEVQNVFLQHPSKNYFRKDFYFIKNYILGLKNIHLNEDDYITSIHGKIRPRATGSI